MRQEIAWYLGICILAWCIGWAAGVAHTSLVKVLESSAGG